MVWWNADSDGIADETPLAGLGGIRIELRDENGNTRSTITGADGSYEFDKLCTGIYTTTIDPAMSWPKKPSAQGSAA
jgi:hypothetical protein